jgi:peptidyl-dipeptidase Dcp
MTSNMNSPEYQAVDKEWSPKLQEANDEITFNEGLFRRIAAVHEGRESANLTPEQKRLVERTYRAYVRNGAQLNAAQKGQLGQINQQLASLFTEFGNRVLADENTWVVLDNQSDLAGLPPSVVASAKAAAEERKLPGKWAIVNTRSSVDPFLTFSTRRDLREKVWRAFVNRGDNAGANDTNQVIAQIVKLRADRAKLLGFDSHAHWRMDDTMAQDPKKAQDLMLRVWRPAVARVREEVRDMQQIANRERGKKITIEPWDYRYYAEKVRKAKYDLDQNEIKPYFELNNMIAASYWTAERLYGLTFKEITGQVPTFHPDIRVYEVTDKNTSKNLGLLYRDDFARAGKRSGAWQSTLSRPRELQRDRDKRHRVQQQQLRQGRARGAGADLAGRRGNAVPRVRPRHSRPGVRRQSIPAWPARRATTSSSRRRCWRIGCCSGRSSTASPSTIRPASPCRRPW